MDAEKYSRIQGEGMQPAYVVAIAVIVAAVAAIVVALLMRHGWTAQGGSTETNERLSTLESDLLAARNGKADLERRLAVEAERSSRIPGLEEALTRKAEQIAMLAQAKAEAESQLATHKEGLTRVEAALQEAKGRFAEAERSREEIRQQLNTLKDGKGRLHEALATKTEAAARIETARQDLNKRLEEAGRLCTQLETRVEALGKEKATLESDLAEKSAVLAEKTEAAAKLETHLDQTTQTLQSAQRDSASFREQLAKLQESLEQERRAAGEKLKLLTDAKERMTQEFKILAADVMQLHGENFSKQNKEQIDAILAPLREKLGEFQQGIQIAHTESTKERATLAEQIRQLTESSAKMTSETSNLTRALKGEAQTQGAWGEMILASILERSGLREGEECRVQGHINTEDGQRVRPDVIVNLPGGQRIVVDSKLSLVAFDAYVNAEEEAVRVGALARHLDSMRGHIKTLASKEYHAAAGSQLDYVIMFVPIEGALAAALQAEPNLTGFAVDNNVAIATPTTLMIALRTVANVWQVERRNRNAEAIADRAGRLYDKLVGFVGDMGTLGERLNNARSSYDAAMGKLSTGSGNVIRQVEQLKGLGAKTNKSLPQSLLGDGEVEMLPAPEVAMGEA
jgi:DNA recombination protein RmuC